MSQRLWPRMRPCVIACLRALADAENTRRRAESAAAEARKYAIAHFARELLAVADNLQRTIAAASRTPETVEIRR